MKILLLGSHGQLGRELLDILRHTKHEVRAFTRADLDLEAPLSPQTIAAIDFDVLINTAAVHRVDDIERDSRSAFLVNTRAVRSLAEACALRKAHLVHVSTDYVYGVIDHIDWLLQPVPYIETIPTAPVNDYGRSKALGEQQALQAWPGCTTIVRVAALFGRYGSSGKGGNFIESMLRATARLDDEITHVVDDQIMSPTHALDAAFAICHLMHHRIPGIFHAVSGGYTSWFGLAAHAVRSRPCVNPERYLMRLQPCKTADRPPQAPRPAWSVLSNQKLENYGYRTPHWTDAVGQYMFLRKP